VALLGEVTPMGYLDLDVRLQYAWLSGRHDQAVINAHVSFRHFLSAGIADSILYRKEI
jgi:hypothetical protein